MSDLIAGFSASSSYSSLAQATSYSSPNRAVSYNTTKIAQEASFSFDAIIAEEHSAPAVSIPFAEGEKNGDDIIDALAEKLAAFLEPFGEKGEKLAEIITAALESLADLVEDTSVDEAALSIDIRFARIEESYSHGAHGRAGVFSGFALEVNVSTKTVDYDPSRATVITTAGAQVEFTQTQMIEGHKRGVFRRPHPGIQSMPGYDQELADQTKQIVDFLKETRKQMKAFSREEEHGFRHQMKQALKDYSHYNMRA